MYTIAITVPSLDILTKLDHAFKAIGQGNEITVTPEKAVKTKPESKPEVMPAFLGKKTEAAPEKDSKELLSKINDATDKLAAIHRDTAVALLAKFDAKKTNQLKPDQYAAYIKAAEEILETNSAGSLT